jgi:hypothetical protein
MKKEYWCWRLTIVSSEGREHILLGSEKEAKDTIERIKGMPKDAIVDWGDNALRADTIEDFKVENIRFSEVLA